MRPHQHTGAHNSDAPIKKTTAVRRAVILAAGMGDRLQPLTSEMPKCLVELNGQPLLLRALSGLAEHGIREAVVVIGYKGDVVRRRVGERFAGVDVRYVEAPDYATTNNIRSLWDAREYLDEDILLLEADVAFDSAVIASLLECQGSSAAVAPHHGGPSGTIRTLRWRRPDP